MGVIECKITDLVSVNALLNVHHSLIAKITFDTGSGNKTQIVSSVTFHGIFVITISD